jgi:hypothetical protein
MMCRLTRTRPQVEAYTIALDDRGVHQSHYAAMGQLANRTSTPIYSHSERCSRPNLCRSSNKTLLHRLQTPPI